MTFKYVMFQYEWGGVQYHYALLFPDNIVHAMVAEAHRYYKHGTEKKWVRPKPVSAGSVTISDSGRARGSGITCHGGSESLEMKPHKDDASIIMLGSNGCSMFPR